MKSLAYRLSLSLLLATSAVAFVACAGGSGSSGFDISSASEAAAIQHALDERRCLERKGLIICPANEGVAAPGTPTSPTPGHDPEIDTTLDHTTSLNCALQPADNVCDLSAQFVPRGFPPGAQFFIAVRPNEGNAPWAINPQQARDAGNGALATPLNVPVQGLEIQVAVLVFENTPEALPPQVAELAASGADFAYVTHVLMLSPNS